MMCSNDDQIKSLAFYVHAIMRHNTEIIRDTTWIIVFCILVWFAVFWAGGYIYNNMLNLN